MSEELRRALLSDDVETFSRLHRYGHRYKDLGYAYTFCLEKKRFKVFLYLTQSPYGKTFKITMNNISWLDLDDEIVDFLLKHPRVWLSAKDYNSFKDIHTNHNELEDLRKEIDDLKEKVLALWYSPGMPGYMLAQEHFQGGTKESAGLIERNPGTTDPRKKFC